MNVEEYDWLLVGGQLNIMYTRKIPVIHRGGRGMGGVALFIKKCIMVHL